MVKRKSVSLLFCHTMYILCIGVVTCTDNSLCTWSDTDNLLCAWSNVEG